MARTEVK